MSGGRTGSRRATPARQPAVPHGAAGDPQAPTPLVSLRGLVLLAFGVLLVALLLPSASRGPQGSLHGPRLTTAFQAITAHRRSTTRRSHAPERRSSGASSSSRSGTTSASSASSGSTATTGGPAPASVHLLVANGSNQNGLAAQVGSYLQAKGYGVLTPVTALTTVPSTLVYPLDPTGQAALGEVLAALGLGQGAVRTAADGPPPVQSATGADLVVVCGPGLALPASPGST
ncbi:LytR C-terminal domain-containing protein [Aciditerrimonas ferrireducens]|uniref:LytR C-terminal domain-containing protein n=1 Tax=Aciditerrimonas ferrireducens TaxID=667306 RepID=UPI00200474D7|nr:LytR C-terminal domain-containing protein [Aciditerrimonas ferrireducens]MCK4175926.1 LytR C-terminal domain-containing protein [Aciditerrimonas ferrireducens]